MVQRSEGPSARPGWEAAAPTACPGPLRVVWRINGKVGLGAAGPQVCLRRTRWRRAAAQARPQHDGQAGALTRRRFTLSSRLPGEVAVRLRLVNGSWPAAPLLPVPREPWSQSSQLFTGGRATGGGRMPEGRKEPGGLGFQGRMVFTAVRSKGSWLALGASLESSTDV